MTSTLLKADLFTSQSQELLAWIMSFTKRFPKWVDSRLLKGLHYLSGLSISPSFMKERSLFHLKRLLLTQFLLQKKIENDLALNKESFLVRIFSIDSLICVAVACPKRKTYLAEETILEIAGQKVPALKKVETSFYAWNSQALPYTFCYVELEKMRGKDLLTSEIKKLESHLEQEVDYYLSEASIFWPYNHEEAFKQLLILSKEISSEEDDPQVSIHFQKQTLHGLEFTTYLIRPKKAVSQKKAITDNHFPISTRLVIHLRKDLGLELPLLAEVFSLTIPIKECKRGTSINLLYARELMAKLLENVIGSFRDYNGGLFETQKKRFASLVKEFSGNIPNFSLFGKELFYALEPVEMQICLETSFFKELFMKFSQILSKTTSTLNKPSSHALILTSCDPDEISFYLKQAKELQKTKKITAYARVSVLSHEYVCLVDTNGNYLKKNQSKQFKCFNFFQQKRVLNLTFQCGELVSLCPYYLAKELRGHTLGKLLFEGLVRLGINNKLTHAGCEDIIFSKKNRSYLFKLRSTKWSNGEKVKAFHYEHTLKRNLLKISGLNLFYNIKHAEDISNNKKNINSLKVKAIDDNHLKIDLQKEDSTFLEKLTHPLFFPYFNETSNLTRFNGPYCVISKSINSLVLEKNPYYWDKESVFFEKIQIQFDHSPSKIYSQFKSKKTAWLGAPFNDHLITSPPVLSQKKIFNPFFIHVNTKYFPLSSPNIRKALSSVIHRNKIISTFFKGNEPLCTIFPEVLSSSKKHLVDNNLIKGRELFEKGLRELKLTLETFPILELSVANLLKHKNLGNYLKQCWETAFGIQIKVKIKDWNDFYRSIERGTYHLGGFFEYLFSSDLESFLRSFSCEKANFSNWTNPHYIKIITSMKEGTKKFTKEKCFAQAENLIFNHMPIIPIMNRKYAYTHIPELRNYIIDQNGSVDFRFSYFQNKPTANQRHLYDQNKFLLNQAYENIVELD